MPGQERSRARSSFDWHFWSQWILVSTLGWLLGWTMVHPVGVGGVVGAAQWLALRRLPRAGWWIAVSAAGWAAGHLIVVVILPPQSGVLAGAVLGVASGLAQWVLLRQWVYQAGWWIVISALGWALALTGVLGVSFVGAVAGAVTGLALEWLLRHARPHVA